MCGNKKTLAKIKVYMYVKTIDWYKWLIMKEREFIFEKLKQTGSMNDPQYSATIDQGQIVRPRPKVNVSFDHRR